MEGALPLSTDLPVKGVPTFRALALSDTPEVRTMSRVLPLLFLLASLVVARSAGAAQPDFRLQVVPAIVYKVDDPGNTETSTFVFDVAVICSTDSVLTPISASVQLSDGHSIVERQEWPTEPLAKMKGEHYRIESDTPLSSPRRMLTLPEAFDLHFYFRCPQALRIGSAEVRVKVADAKGRMAERTLMIPVQYYQQKTSLIVPFRGNGVVGQDWITNGGHGGGGNWGADFAIDLRGLGENGAEQKSQAQENASAAGWGREILAPAAGTVTYARNDVPDNPHPGRDDTLYAALHDPVMAWAGNCVIIDHGNSEFSVMMHMQEGSVMVKVGDRVAAGQVIGKLGNSGNAFGPHLHYQLQSGPRLFVDQGLPFKFQNIDVAVLARGRQFEAK
ncbi:MAG TPA: M23 family metallopeptidase [Candidatus Eisenbacteria bacterium]|nr:M23 family metallopeptidase [Candidatus Eisenbacteria bacterium]